MIPDSETARKFEWSDDGLNWTRVPLGTFGPQSRIEELLDSLSPPERDKAMVIVGDLRYRIRVALVCKCCQREFP